MSVRFDNTSEFLFDNMSSYLIIGVFLLIIRVRLGLMGTKRGRDPKTRSSIVIIRVFLFDEFLFHNMSVPF